MSTASQPDAFWPKESTNTCGRDLPWTRGLCRACYRAARHSLEHFGCLRDGILTRDSCHCRACGLERLRDLAAPDFPTPKGYQGKALTSWLEGA